MAFFSLSKKPAGEVALIIDVGSESVEGALVHFVEGSKPKVLYEARQPIAFQEKVSRDQLFSNLLLSLNRLLERVQKEGILHLNFTGLRRRAILKIFCTLSAPWHVSGVRVVKVSFTKPVEVTWEFLGDIIKKEREDFLKNNSPTSFQKLKESSEFIEAQTMKIALNGYETEEPEGKEINDFEAALFMSISPLSVVSPLRQVFLKHFHVASVEFHSFTFVSFTTLRDFFPNEQSFLAVYVGGEVTEITVVREGMISQSLSFPLGHNMLLRRIIEKMPNTSPGIALSLLRLHGSGKESRDLSLKIEKVINQLEEDWISLFYDSLTELSGELFLPKTVFVFGCEDSADVFSSLVKKQKLVKEGGREGTFNVVSVDKELLKPYCEFTKISEGDPFLVTEGMFLQRLLEHKS